jgi:UDP-GlcNAc:undecaprenyl-phosphate/decaprenyl-phosphate GlcNAc-1-phosphate transferase
MMDRLLLLGTSVLAGLLLCPLLPGALRAAGLERTNYQGQRICSGGGLLFVASAIPWLWLGGGTGAVPAAAAALGFGLLGLLDDWWGTAEHKGLRGHLQALRQGRLTTGLIKAIGGLVLAVGLAWQLQPAFSGLLAALLIALSANFFNLLDLRPLRALKAFWLLGLGLAWTGPLLLIQFLGLSLPYARLEARRTVMLGDTGSNALGAVLGVVAATVLPGWGEGLAVLALLSFHLWAEKHSFSAWIERHPWARRLDGYGWDADR